MADIISYIKKTESEYGITINYKRVCRKEEELKNIPEILRELYKKTDGICFPFGTIYSLEEAEKHLKSSIQEKCFCFGQDYTKDHIWLCLYKPNELGKSFDFSSIYKPDKINGLYADLIEFLEDMRFDYDDDPWNKSIN